MIQAERSYIAPDYGFSSELLSYLVERNLSAGERLPSTEKLAEELGISLGKLREQLEVARELGLVEIKPKVGVTINAFSFFHSIRTGMRYAVLQSPKLFMQIGEVRNHIEASFWREAVERLQEPDKRYLQQLIEQAWEKLEGDPIQIPHLEHRELHLTIFSRLENVFVRGLIEAYWDAYEAVGLNLYADYAYLKVVWEYHTQMVEAILEDRVEEGFRILVKHSEMISQRDDLTPST